jgi:hypothetical protein
LGKRINILLKSQDTLHLLGQFALLQAGCEKESNQSGVAKGHLLSLISGDS